MGKAITIVAILMAILHQDFWNWDNGNLVFGFIPVALAYHAAFSLACAALWFCTIKFAWPSKLEAWADEE